ncbi:hypothetical protein WN48_01527 [Eufriesea mexicana]|nr:hypothetical protein WN48_01527 [Eufriesea mexicana]
MECVRNVGLGMRTWVWKRIEYMILNKVKQDAGRFKGNTYFSEIVDDDSCYTVSRCPREGMCGHQGWNAFSSRYSGGYFSKAAYQVRDSDAGRYNMTLGKASKINYIRKSLRKCRGVPIPFEITPLLGGLIGVVTALLFVTIAILVAMKIRNERRAQRTSDQPLKKSTAPSSEDLYDTDDRNPDVVPINKGSDYQLTGSISGTPLGAQNTPDGLSSTSLSVQQVTHLPGLSSYAHEYNNYPSIPVSYVSLTTPGCKLLSLFRLLHRNRQFIMKTIKYTSMAHNDVLAATQPLPAVEGPLSTLLKSVVRWYPLVLKVLEKTKGKVRDERFFTGLLVDSSEMTVPQNTRICLLSQAVPMTTVLTNIRCNSHTLPMSKWSRSALQLLFLKLFGANAQLCRTWSISDIAADVGCEYIPHHTNEKSPVQPAEEVNPRRTLVGLRRSPGEIPVLAHFSWATSGLAWI